jgi:Ca2+-binding EF-hand superfamily protein
MLKTALLATGLLCIAELVGPPVTARQTGQSLSKDEQKRLEAAEREAKMLLLYMDKDKSGKVSKQEFMKFMEEEFERLDINKDGELDVKELTQSHVIVRSRAR